MSSKPGTSAYKTSSRRAPRRYQLNKAAVHAVQSRHPWIFRSHMSSAAEGLASGSWLELVGADNKVLGYGLFDREGVIAIRVFSHGATAPDRDFFKARLRSALQKRAQLRKYTNAFRAIHGENDGLPGIVLDIYGDLGVLQTYSDGVDPIGRYLASLAAQELGLKTVIAKAPVKRKKQTDSPVRVLRGLPQKTVTFREGKLELTVEPMVGQKSGAFLDLRGLRKWISLKNLKDARVLNLFSYTGTLGLAADIAGAKEIWNVDISEGALSTAKRFHSPHPGHHRFLKEDVFKWIETLPKSERFDLIIVDPPQMTSDARQVSQTLAHYGRLYRRVMPHLRKGGSLVGCCCTSRIARSDFEQTLKATLGPTLKLKQTIAPEDDHPVVFPEGDYLKILVFG